MGIGRDRIKRLSGVLLCAFLVLGVAACGNNANDASDNADILTQKKTEVGCTQISVLVKYAYTINGFEKAVEEKFPDIDIVQVGNYTGGMGIDEYESRLKNDDLTDIVMTWPLEVGEEYWEERLIDLSGMEFTGKYDLAMLNRISKEGKLFYLPGPSQIRGIVYNKTLFEENGWEVPRDYRGFSELCKTIEKSGMRSLQLGFQDPEVLDTAFMGFNYGDYFSSPEDGQWIDDYNGGTGDFGDHFSGAYDVFQQMIDNGIWRKEDLDVNYTERERMLFRRECAMVEDSVLITKLGYSQTGSMDEFALMPFFNPGLDNNDWARVYMVCYIGLNKHLQDKGNEDKYELVKKIMEYISTEEGQEAMTSDTGGMMSSVLGVQSANVPEIEDLQLALSQGRYAVFPPFKNVQSAFREGLAGMVAGEMTKEEALGLIDKQNAAPLAEEKPQKIGEATETFSLIDSGSYIADVVRDYAKTDIGLFMDNGKDGTYNGKGVSGKFYEGDITVADLGRILPDLKAGDPGVLWKGSMTGENLKKTLEYSIPVENNKVGWFYYFSGLKMAYDPCAEQGTRITSITTAEGQDIEDEKEYTLAIMGDTVPEDYLITCDKTEITIREILQGAIEKAVTISPAKDQRFIISK